MTKTVRLRLISLGAVAALLASMPVALVAADTGGTAPGDSSSGTVHVDPAGPAGVSTVGVQATTSDSGGSGQIDLGTNAGGSSNNSSANTGPLPCPFTGPVHLTDSIPLPAVKIDSGPPVDKGAVAGVPTWFWADGYSGDWWKPKSLGGYYWKCELTNDGPYWHTIGVTVPVVTWAGHYVWDFGDGQTHEGWCGSDSHQGDCADDALGVQDGSAVNHMYTKTSAGTQKGYKVSIAVGFFAQLNGSGGPILGPYFQGDSVFLPVREIQSVLVPVPSP